MAECAVTFAIQKLESLLEQELVRDRRIIEDVTEVIIAFKTTQVVLKDADKWSEMEGAVKVWVTRLRHVAFEFEDLIDEYVFHHHQQQPTVQGHWTSRSIHKVKQFFNVSLMRRGRRSLGARIQNNKVEIENISERTGRYGFAVTQDTTLVDTAHTESLIDIESLRQQGDAQSIFSLIYNDLPCHLKSCLLYLCLFPEDYVIDCSRLLCLWAAEGFFIPRFDEAMTKEEVAKHYLDDLIARRLIQVQDIDVCGRVRTCRIHDILRKFILRKAREQDFAQFSYDMEPDNHSIRRLSIANENEDKNIFPKDTRLLHQIRSFFAYGKSSLFNSSTISLFLVGGVKLMKILDLEGVHLKEFPGEILTNLCFLRYLGINTEKFSHPSYLGRLVNLETLVLKGHLLFQLPYEILQLKCLRNLFGDLLELPNGIGGMTTLEKLNLVVGYDGIDKELRKLTRLRSLCIVRVMKEDKNFVLSSLETMSYLRCLYLRLSKPKDNVLDVHNLSNFPPLLQSLTLVGAMNDIPWQIFSLENLAELKLSYSGIPFTFFERLQLLSKLVVLVLEMDAIDDTKLHFRMGSFSKLVTLELNGLSKLESIGIREGAMPCIQNIRFINCPLVEHVPVGIEHLTTLKRIGLAKMASNLEGELRRHYHWTAGHSPTVKSFADELDMDSSTIRSFVDELDTAD